MSCNATCRSCSPRDAWNSRGSALTGVGFLQHLLAVHSCEDPQRFSSTSLSSLHIHGGVPNMPLHLKLTACTCAQLPPRPAAVLPVLCLSKQASAATRRHSIKGIACWQQHAHLDTASLLSALQCAPALRGPSSCHWHSPGYSSRLQDPWHCSRQEMLSLRAQQPCVSHFWAAVSSGHSLPKPPKRGSEKSCFRPSACILAQPIGSRLPVTRHVNTLPRACTP